MHLDLTWSCTLKAFVLGRLLVVHALSIVTEASACSVVPATLLFKNQSWFAVVVGVVVGVAQLRLWPLVVFDLLACFEALLEGPC